MSEAEVRGKMEDAMREIEDFYFGEEEDAGEQMFNKFAATHAAKFVGFNSVYEDEHTLEQTTAYQQFQTLFEAKLEEIVARNGLTVPVFFEQLKKDA
jgi:hypothetical protein